MLAWRAPRATAQLCAAALAPRRGFAAGGHGGEVKQGLTTAGLAVGGGIAFAGVTLAVAIVVGLEGVGVPHGDRTERGLEAAAVAHGDRMKAGLVQGGALVGAGAAVSSSVPGVLAGSLWWLLGRPAPSAQPAGDTPLSTPPHAGAQRANAAAPPPTR